MKLDKARRYHARWFSKRVERGANGTFILTERVVVGKTVKETSNEASLHDLSVYGRQLLSRKNT